MVRDDLLRLIFTCCHPALSMEARVALTLRILCGMTTVEIARVFLVPEATMGQRISRAKKKIATARIPYRVPADHELPDRLPAALAVVHAVVTAGHHAPEGRLDTRFDLADEGIRLARLLHQLMPDEPECAGLLALALATHARRDARLDGDGRLVLLPDQDRSRWRARRDPRSGGPDRRRHPSAADRPVPAAGRHRLPPRPRTLGDGDRLAADRRAVPDARAVHSHRRWCA